MKEIGNAYLFSYRSKALASARRRSLDDADKMTDLQAKAVMTQISYEYERLAKRAEEGEVA